MLTRFIRIQLVLFTILTVIALVVLGWYYLSLPRVAGIGQYTLHADLPASGGLYKTANVTYRGIQIGKVTDVQPTEQGARATMSINSRYKIPVDATANVHSVSAVGEQYLDLVSTGAPNQYFANGQTITKGTVPSEVGPALDAANHGLAVLPAQKIPQLLDETSQAVAGLGPGLQRLVDSTQAIAHDFKDNLNPVNDIVANSGPILSSQVESGDAIQRWAANLNTIAAQAAEQDQALRSGLQQAAPTLDAVSGVFSDVRESLPQTLANLEIVIDMLKRYHKGVEQALVIFPQGASIAETATSVYPGEGLLHLGLSINQPPPCLTGFLPASEWRAPSDTSTRPLPTGTYCKIPKDFQANVVRGARNYPCADVPGKRAASPNECHSNEPYIPLGTNPWYGDPNQIRNCPAPAARCDQPVDPGKVIPAPSINNGMNPLPADQLPQPPQPISDPLSPPRSGSVQCSGQQPNPCIYTPAPSPSAVYSPQSGQVVAPDGTKFTVSNSTNTGDDGWKEMLAPPAG
ncbi:MCE family protein [Mycobacterium sp.]|uniref:MCE family protein n=1 Tax=Mycobacterium sp. TaxID=1785 RepID=UPI002D441DFB|nr:MCE family protein [Mycobacterium sp.]HZA11323.1 MCE family protein [Mycobacterium sp.]